MDRQPWLSSFYILLLSVLYFTGEVCFAKPQYKLNIFDACPGDVPVVQCDADPCLTTKCSAFPEAICRVNLCGGCRAEFLQYGKLVDCSKPYVPRWFDDCPPDSPVVQCSDDPCFNNECKRYPQAYCRTNLCGACRPEFVLDDRVIDCAATGNDNTTSTTESTGCPSGESRVSCAVNPCTTASCPAKPTAVCEPNYCGSCKAEFFENGQKVDCGQPGSGSLGKCPPDEEVLKCVLNPCTTSTCDAYPTAKCQTNYCQPCVPEFYVDGIQVNCTKKTTTPTSSTTGCPDNVALVNCIIDPCEVAVCPAVPSAKCRSNYCGGCNADFYLNGKQVNCALPTEGPELRCESSKFGCCADGRSIAQGVNKEGCPGVHGKCLKDRRRAILSDYRRRYIPTCSLDGTYTALQCWRHVKVCWCVDLEGNEKHNSRSVNRKPICDRRTGQLQGPTVQDCRQSPFGCCPDGTTSASGPYLEGCKEGEVACWNSQFGCCPDGLTEAQGPNLEECARQSTECEKDRDSVVSKSNGPLVGQYIPQCDKEGKYLKMQCHGSTGQCWCVDEKGREYKDSRKPGKADCHLFVPSCIDLRDDCQSFTPFCTVFVAYMKTHCAKTCGICTGKRIVVLTELPTVATTPRASIATQLMTSKFISDETTKKIVTTESPATTTNVAPTTTKRPVTTRKRGCGSLFGCCKDGLLPAMGPDYLGCPVYSSICQMPAVTGNCRAAFRRYFFNHQRQSCEPFIYGGCDGNANNFETKESCEHKCDRDRPDVGTPKVSTGKPTKKITTAKETTSKPTTTEQITTTKQASQPECFVRRQNALTYYDGNLGLALISNELYTPKCNEDGEFQRVQCWAANSLCWCVDQDGNEIENTRTFDSRPFCPARPASKCKDLRGGCKLYASRRYNYCETYTDYMKTYCAKSCNLCDPEPKRPGCGSKYGCCQDGATPSKGLNDEGCPVYDSICNMKKRSGPCFAYIKRYFYNSETKKCEEFIYGGCNGNMNNFVTEVECESRCKEQVAITTTTIKPTTEPSTAKAKTTAIPEPTTIPTAKEEEKTTTAIVPPTTFPEPSTEEPSTVKVDTTAIPETTTISTTKEEEKTTTAIIPPTTFPEPSTEEPSTVKVDTTAIPEATTISTTKEEEKTTTAIIPPTTFPEPSTEEPSTVKVDTTAIPEPTTIPTTKEEEKTTTAIIPPTTFPEPSTEEPSTVKVDTTAIPETTTISTTKEEEKTTTAIIPPTTFPEPTTEEPSTEKVDTTAIPEPTTIPTTKEDEKTTTAIVPPTTFPEPTTEEPLSLPVTVDPMTLVTELITSTAATTTRKPSTRKRPGDIKVVSTTKITSTEQPEASQSTTMPPITTFEAKDVTECQRIRALFVKELTNENATIPRGMFVPACDEDGRFSQVQCWRMIGLCWCVGQHDGKELPGTRVNASIDGRKPDCFKGQLTKCENQRITAMKNAENFELNKGLSEKAFIPDCESNGRFAEVQCYLASNECFCVDAESGRKIPGFAKRGDTVCSKEERLSKCVKARKEALRNSLVVDGKLIPPLGVFVPVCNVDGTFAEIQCNLSTNECWCVNKGGETREETRTRGGKPNCEVSLTACQRLQETTISGLKAANVSDLSEYYIPKCDESGGFVAVQCWDSLNVCWCVDGDGNEVENSKTDKGKIPICAPRNMTKCEQKREMASDDSYVATCDENGEFTKVQCSTKNCWCVDKDGKEIEGTRTATGDPVCEKKAPLTECQKQRQQFEKRNEESGHRIVGAFVPRCEEDGTFSPSQCHGSTGYCWCATKSGTTLEHTKMQFNEPDCKRILAGNITACEHRRQFIMSRHDGAPPKWHYVPQCDVSGSYTKQQCNKETGHCWCVNEAGKMTRWLTKGQASDVCHKEKKSKCELAYEHAHTKAFLINKRYPTMPLGAYVPQCQEDGAYNDKQCHSSTGFCWCVDADGNEVNNTRTRLGDINCKRLLAGNFTKCELDRASVLNTKRRSNEPKSYYVPQCASNGDYLVLQCHDELNKCWCVNLDGFMTGWAKKDEEDEYYCELKTNVTKCEQRRQDVYKRAIILDHQYPLLPLGAFLAKCKEDGSFENMQCNEGYCWCVDEQGSEITQTLTRFDEPECDRLASRNITLCENYRQTALQESDSKKKNFVFKCESDGKFASVQCDERRAKCWCVNQEGKTVVATISNATFPDCNTDKHTKCQRKRQEAYNNGYLRSDGMTTPLVGAYVAQCKDNGEYEETQCHGSTGYCWCVDKDGKKLEDTEKRFERPKCGKPELTACQKKRKEQFDSAPLVNGKRLLPPGAFVPKCKDNGDFEETQCHGSTGYCWCVDKDGKKLKDTKKRFEKPQCERILAGNLTKCERSKGIPNFLDSFAAQCEIDGSFRQVQCNGFPNVCRCVDKNGTTIPGTYTRRGSIPDCTPKILTACQQKRKDVFENAPVVNGKRLLPPGAFVPKCKDNGDFEERQCHGSTGYCWCVDKDGNKLQETARRFQKPQCKRILAGNLTKCEKSKADPNLLDSFDAQCEIDGSFRQVQCNGFTNVCWCVDKNGTDIPGTETRESSTPDCTPKILTACQQKRKDVFENAPVVNGKRLLPPGAFVPKCKDNGDFEERQCHGSTGYCWCVDKDGSKLQATSRRFEKPQCERILAGNLTKCERSKADPDLLDSFDAQCEIDGSFKQVQCNGFTNVCWCVDKNGTTIPGTHTRESSTPDCTPKILSVCERKRKEQFDNAPLVNGKRLLPPGSFVPNCKDNGDYEETQCHGSTGYCWCVDKDGKELDITFRRFEKPQCKRILAGNLTKCERSKADPNLLDSFDARCEIDGSFRQVQCNGFTNVCWCVDKNGTAISGTEAREGSTPDCTSKMLTVCQRKRSQILNEATVIDGKPLLPPGAFVPKCKDNGEYEGTQCHGSTGYCWCVDKNGSKLPATSRRFEKPQCERILAGNLTKCEKSKADPNLLDSFDAQCEVDGSFKQVQCNGFTNVCWCVDKNGTDIPGTETRESSTPDCTPKMLTACQKKIKSELENAPVVNGKRLLPPGAFVPKCKDNGDFEERQCHGSTGYCWCVDKDGKEFDIAFRRFERPQCKRLLAGNLTKCEKSKADPNLLDSFDAQCEINGSFRQVQCNGFTNVCWCVDKNGTTIPGTETRESLKPDCKAATQRCKKQLHEAYKRASFRNGVRVFPPGMFVPSCNDDGTYNALQCHASSGYCWCVERNGEKVLGTRVRFGKPNCERILKGNLTECERVRRNGSSNSLPGRFVPKCEDDGSYSEVQCHGSTGYCWCVDELGKKREDTEVRGKKPECTKKLRKSCQGLVDEAKQNSRNINGEKRLLVGAFVPKCKPDGSFEETQCHGSTGYCWCVDKDGSEIEATKTRRGRPNCARILSGNLTKCELRHKQSIDIMRESGPLAVSFVPKCDLDGSFLPIQCWKGECWCVNDEGHMLYGTRTSRKPDCKISTPKPATKCEELRREANEKLKTGDLKDNEYVPRCDEDGQFARIQCWGATVECFCVDNNGTEVMGTRKRGRPDCETVISTKSPTKEAITTRPVTTSVRFESTTTKQPPVEATTKVQPPVEATTTKQPPIEATTTEQPPAEATTTEQPPVEATTTEQPPVEATTTKQPPVEATTTQQPPVEATTTEQPPVEATTTGQPPVEATTTEQPPVEATTTEQPPVEATTTEQPPVEATTTEQPPVEATTTEQPPAEATTTEQPPVVATTTEQPPVEATTTKQPPVEATTTEQPPVEATTTGQPPVEATTTEQPPVEATTTEQPPVEATTTKQPPVEATTTEQPPAEATTTEQPPVEATTTEQPPVEATTTKQPPVEATTTEQPPAEATTTEQPPVEATTTEQPPVEATTTEQRPVEATTTKQPPVEATTTEQPPAEATTTEQPPVEATTTEQPPVEATTTKQPPVEATTTEQPPAEATTTEQPPVEATTTEQSPVEATTAKPFVVTTSKIATEKPTVSEIKTANISTTVSTSTELHLSACLLPRDPGPCKGRFIRHHYDKGTKDCVGFIYGGCKGNANNFATAEECVQQCRYRIELTATKKPSEIKENEEKSKAVTGCNSEFGCCDDQVTPAKGINQAGCPVYQSHCEYPPSKGNCKARITRWYYNARLKTCNKFIWNGCNENRNNFPDFKACMKSCDASAKSTNTTDGDNIGGGELGTTFIPGCLGEYGCCNDGMTSAKGPNQEGCPVYDTICDMPAVRGFCQDASVIRYHYNNEAGRCEAFKFSNCGGNENNFPDPKSCEEKCVKKVPCVDKLKEICVQWKALGYCTSRWRQMLKYCQKSCDLCFQKRRR